MLKIYFLSVNWQDPQQQLAQNVRESVHLNPFD